MQPLTQKISGQLFRQETLVGLLLDPTAGAEEHQPGHTVYLRYGLVVQGSERHIFPALLLDDWGRERKTLSLYRWIFEEGQRFPRAELFGFRENGEQTQIFLRDLEIFFKYPCYAFTAPQLPVTEGEQLHAVLLADPQHGGAPRQVEVPQGVTWPLKHAAVLWHRANPDTLEQHGWRPA